MTFENISPPEDLRRFIDDFVATFPAVTEIWLFGSRANSKAQSDSDWDLMVFSGDRLTPKMVEPAKRFYDERFQLFIASGGYFKWPWLRRDGVICDGWLCREDGDHWHWTPRAGDEGWATYRGESGTENTVRIWRRLSDDLG